MSKITLADLKPGYYAGMPPNGWFERWLCHAEGCTTFHWIWLVKPVLKDGQLVDYVTSESIAKGTSLSRVAGRAMKVWRLKGDPAITSYEIIDVHSEYGELPYGWGMDFWTGISFIVQHYLHKAIPVFKFKGINCISWVDFGSAQLGHDIIPEGEYVTEAELENSPKLEYVGELN